MTTFASIISFPSLPDDHWGLCPECRKPTSVFLQIDRVTFACCELHKVCWVSNLNLSFLWLQNLTAEDWELWERNMEILNANYREVLPAFHEREKT